MEKRCGQFSVNRAYFQRWQRHRFEESEPTGLETIITSTLVGVSNRVFASSSCDEPTPQQSAVIPGAKSPAEAGEMLGRLIDDPDHVFLEAKSKQFARLQELLARCHGHNKVNDASLIWLASLAGERADLRCTAAQSASQT